MDSQLSDDEADGVSEEEKKVDEEKERKLKENDEALHKLMVSLYLNRYKRSQGESQEEM